MLCRKNFVEKPMEQSSIPPSSREDVARGGRTRFGGILRRVLRPGRFHTPASEANSHGRKTSQAAAPASRGAAVPDASYAAWRRAGRCKLRPSRTDQLERHNRFGGVAHGSDTIARMRLPPWMEELCPRSKAHRRWSDRRTGH